MSIELADFVYFHTGGGSTIGSLDASYELEDQTAGQDPRRSSDSIASSRHTVSSSSSSRRRMQLPPLTSLAPVTVHNGHVLPPATPPSLGTPGMLAPLRPALGKLLLPGGADALLGKQSLLRQRSVSVLFFLAETSVVSPRKFSIFII